MMRIRSRSSRRTLPTQRSMIAFIRGACGAVSTIHLPATRQPHLLHCGVCGRRMESCWANSRAAYRCRHGHTSASKADPDRPKNLYIREDRILPHLRALWVLLSGSDPAPGTAEVISHLRAGEITLTYDPQSRALQTGTPREVKLTVDRTR